jgi:hypothetical protein
LAFWLRKLDKGWYIWEAGSEEEEEEWEQTQFYLLQEYRIHVDGNYRYYFMHWIKKNLKFEKQYLGFTILETILSKIKIRLSHDHYYT